MIERDGFAAGAYVHRLKAPSTTFCRFVVVKRPSCGPADIRRYRTACGSHRRRISPHPLRDRRPRAAPTEAPRWRNARLPRRWRIAGKRRHVASISSSWWGRAPLPHRNRRRPLSRSSLLVRGGNPGRTTAWAPDGKPGSDLAPLEQGVDIALNLVPLVRVLGDDLRHEIVLALERGEILLGKLAPFGTDLLEDDLSRLGGSLGFRGGRIGSHIRHVNSPKLRLKHHLNGHHSTYPAHIGTNCGNVRVGRRICFDADMFLCQGWDD